MLIITSRFLLFLVINIAAICVLYFYQGQYIRLKHENITDEQQYGEKSPLLGEKVLQEDSETEHMFSEVRSDVSSSREFWWMNVLYCR